jgi:ribosomal protein S18 acetylase RimI-like enzyme
VKEKISKIVINNQEFILRPAQENDYDFTFNLLKENMLESFNKNWGGWNDKSFKDNYHKENIRIIEFKNRNEGYVDFKFKTDCGYINQIQLSEKIRGKGLGTNIMLLLEQETSNQGLSKIRLKVFNDNRAIKLYERLGYKTISQDDTSSIMEKDLDTQLNINNQNNI